ncbi:MAG: hypothetical protein IT303_14320 [Dehalococcoidia bacterium]|nr:hypothetical protein [Dehalococcoidia bacterium]
MAAGTPPPGWDPRVGLCSVCSAARRVESGKGSLFWLCERSKDDPRFRRYPPLPVTRCAGFEARPEPPGA